MKGGGCKSQFEVHVHCHPPTLSCPPDSAQDAHAVSDSHRSGYNVLMPCTMKGGVMWRAVLPWYAWSAPHLLQAPHSWLSLMLCACVCAWQMGPLWECMQKNIDYYEPQLAALAGRGGGDKDGDADDEMVEGAAQGEHGADGGGGQPQQGQ